MAIMCSTLMVSGVVPANISYAAITFGDSTGYINDFVLSEAIPEPNLIMLLGFGGAILWLRLRIQR